MLIRLPFIGTGIGGDAVRHPLPTGALVGIDPVAGTCTVDVPDADSPANPPAPGAPGRPNTVYGPVLTQIPAAVQQAWVAALKARYPTSNIPANLAPQ